jgi:hypothetical protein
VEKEDLERAKLNGFYSLHLSERSGNSGYLLLHSIVLY